jgi:hypothetical protein
MSKAFTLQDISDNRGVGWFLADDHKTVKQVITLSPYKDQTIGLLTTSEAKKAASDLKSTDPVDNLLDKTA